MNQNNDKVIMGINGELAIAIPLFRMHEYYHLGNVEGYSLSLFGENPIAYAIDMGTTIELVDAELLEKSGVEFLGDL